MLLGAFMLVMGFMGAENFLAAPAQSAVKADLLVALGGDNGGRAERVLELYRCTGKDMRPGSC